MPGPVGEGRKFPSQSLREQHGYRRGPVCVRGDNLRQCPKRYVPFVCLVIWLGKRGPKMAESGESFS